MKIIAAVVENEIFEIMDMNDFAPFQDRFTNGFLSNPSIIESTNYSNIPIGSFYCSGLFYYSNNGIKGDLIFEDPENNKSGTTRFTYVSNGIVFGRESFENETELHRMFIAAYLSNPQFIDITDFDEANKISVGWIWDGKKFNPPCNTE